MRILDNFKCNDCDHEFEDFHDTTTGEQPNCSKCDSESVTKHLSPVHLSASDGNFHNKVPDGFRDILKEHGRKAGSYSRIDTNSSGI